MMEVGDGHGPTVECHEMLYRDRGNHAEEIDPEESRSECEMGQGRSGRRVMVAIDWDSQNGGHLVATGGHLDHDSDFCPDLDWILDLCDGPCPGDHGLDRRSSGLSAPDSYGTQPLYLRQRHHQMPSNVDTRMDIPAVKEGIR
jgi:hypothetical protein